MVYYREDPGQWVWTASATSPGAATITALAMSITVVVPPTGGASWPSGSTQSLGWTLSSAVSTGQFGVWLVDASDGAKWYGAGFFDAEAGKTGYSPSFSTSGIPVGTYRVVAYYHTDPGLWMWTANASEMDARVKQYVVPFAHGGAC